jgi:hypothetical protein
MFGFFTNKSNKIDDLQISQLASELESVFASLFPDGDIPNLFVLEPYVRGFIIGYSSAVMDLKFGALGWTKDRKGKFQLNLYQKISFTRSCGFDKFLQDLDFARELASNPDFCMGRDHGAVCAVVIHDKLKAGVSDPLIESAQKAADELQIDFKSAIFVNSITAFKLKWN